MTDTSNVINQINLNDGCNDSASGNRGQTNITGIRKSSFLKLQFNTSQLSQNSRAMNGNKIGGMTQSLQKSRSNLGIISSGQGDGSGIKTNQIKLVNGLGLKQYQHK